MIDIKTARDLDKLNHDEKEHLKNQLTCMYTTLTIDDVAESIGLTKKTTVNVFRKLGIPFRNRKETAQFMKLKWLEKYGVDNPMKLDEVKAKSMNAQRQKNGGKLAFNTDKQKQTVLNRYGTDNVMKDAGVKQKLFQTNLKKYGYSCSLLNDVVKKKAQETNLRKYGAENVLCKGSSIRPNVGFDKRPDTIRKSLETLCKKYGGVGLGSKEIAEKIKRTNFEKYGYENPSLPIMHGRSKHEDTIYNYITEKYPNLVILRNKRSLMNINKRYEIDIYIPELKVGFEIDGRYTHDRDAYIKDIKNNTCNTKERLKEIYSEIEGITLYNLWESDIDSDFSKVATIIDNALGVKNEY